MKQQIPKKRNLQLATGTMILGKWHAQTYTVIRKLGSGTVGTVYLCKHKGRSVALKISEHSLSMTKEVQSLKMLQKTKVQDSGLGPCLLDVDDWEIQPGKTLSFYVMEYIDGIHLHTFIKKKGTVWLFPLLFQLLTQLERLHKAGYIFGDLKSDNIIVTDHPPTLRLIDVGGITKKGRSIKEYTNFYDRAYWQLGTRLAEPSYDLFAVTMILVSLFYPKKFTRTERNEMFLRQKLLRIQPLRKIAPVLLKAMTKGYEDVASFRKKLQKQLASDNGKQPEQTRKNRMSEVLLIICTTSLFYLVYFVMTTL